MVTADHPRALCNQHLLDALAAANCQHPEQTASPLVRDMT
jgi:hypothetical protein